MATSSLRNATDQFTYALEAGAGFFHIVTDSFIQTFLLLERAYFRRDTDSPDYVLGQDIYAKGHKSERYIKLSLSTDSYIPADRDGCVFYTSPTSENSRFSPEQITAMTAFNERRCIRRIRDSACTLQEKLPVLVLYGREITLPPILESQVSRVTFPPLTHDDIRDILRRELPNVSSDVVRCYETLAGGFSEIELAELLADIKSRGVHINELDNVRSIIRHKKKQKLAIHGKLACEDESIRSETAGMNNIMAYLRKEKRNIETGFRSRGMLVVGMPGSGKTAIAKASAHELGLPLIRMDMSRILGSLVGESEKNMHEALSDLQAMSPCVFWIDEIEKALAGSKGEDNSGVVVRLMGMLLTFMQESEKCVFTVATANSVSRLPGELFRNMRIDARFAAMLPDYEACSNILSLRLDMPPNKNGELEELLEIVTNMAADDKGEFKPHYLTGADITAIAEEFCKMRKINPSAEKLATMRSVCRYILPTAISGSGAIKVIAESYCDILKLNVMMADGSGLFGDADVKEALFEPSRYDPGRKSCMIPPPGNRITLDGNELDSLARSIRNENYALARFSMVRRMFDSLMFRDITKGMDTILSGRR